MAARVILLAFDGAQGLDIFGPGEVFGGVARIAGKPAYEVVVASVGGGTFRTTAGVAVRAVDVRKLRPRPSDTALVVGGEREALRAAVERFAEGRATGVSARALIAVVGAPGAGRRTLIEAVTRDVAVASAAGVLPALELWRGDVAGLERFVAAEAPAGPDPDEARLAQLRHAALAAALERRPGRPLVAVLTEGPSTDAFVSFWAGAAPSGRVLIVAPARGPIDRPFAENLVLGPLVARDVATLVARAAGERAPEGAVAEIVAASGGHAAVAAVLARRLVQAMRAGRGGEVRFERGADLDALLAGGLAELPREARRLVVDLAVAGPHDDEPETRAAAADAEALSAAASAGWVLSAPPAAPRLPSDAHRRVALAALAAPDLAAVARRALQVLPAGDPRRADALAALGRGDEAAVQLRAAAARYGAEGRHVEAALFLERARALGPAPLALEEDLALATGMAVAGRYGDATGVLDHAASHATGAALARVAERRAWVLARRGDLASAREVLERALAAGGDGAEGVALRARLGRLLVTSGRFRDALVVLDSLPAAGRPDPLVLEGIVLAHAYQGDAARARAACAALDALPGANPARRAYLAALVEQLAGEGRAAVAHYRTAYALAQKLGEVHTLAAVALNLGALLADQGLYGEERLLKHAEGLIGESPDGMIRGIFEDVKAYADGELQDDVALVAVRMARPAESHPTPTPPAR